jgi:molybdate/tungstate transport system ATP-binding protein
MLEVKNLHLQLGTFSLFDINFKVNKGEYYIILGPTGAGKSVVIETIAGILLPDKGQILIQNQDISRLKPEKRQISVCYQDYVLFPHLTVEGNIKYGWKYRKNQDLQTFQELIHILKIDHILHRYPENLSGGEKQRVSLARALIVKPEVLLLDEPLSALDSHIKDQLMRDIKLLHQEFKMTTIMVTHSFKEAFFLGERACVIHEGKTVQSGTMEEIFRYPNSPFVSNFVGLKNVFPSTQLGSIKLDAAFIGIRPENIQIQKEFNDYHYQGIIEEIADMGNYYEVILGCDFAKVTTMVMISDFIKSNYKLHDIVTFGFNHEDIQKIDHYQT